MLVTRWGRERGGADRRWHGTAWLLLVVVFLAPAGAAGQVAPTPTSTKTTARFDLLLPLEAGASVWASGPHSALKDSVDFGTRDSVVVHAANGVLSYFALDGFANCSAVITHESGWKTTYLHLMNADQSLDGTTVHAGQRFAYTGQPSTNIADGSPNPEGNTCALGTPGFPHLRTCPRPTTPFLDVETTSFAFEDVACLYGLGITAGTSASTVDPHALVTRAQMAGFLGRLWNAATQ